MQYLLKIMIQAKQQAYLSILIACFVLFGCEQYDTPVSTHVHATDGVYAADISEDGRFALISTINHNTGYWDLEKNALLFNWKHRSDSGVFAVDLSPDNLFAITTDDKTFVIWDTQTGESLGYWEANDRIRDVAISNKGQYVLLGLENGLAIHINMKTGRRLEFPAHGHANAILSVDMTPNGRYALTGGTDYRAMYWDTKTAQIIRLWEHKSRVNYVSLNHDGSLAFTAGGRANAHVWDINSGEKLSSLKLKSREYVISAARISPSGKYILTGAAGRQLRLWRTDTGDNLKNWRVSTRHEYRPSGAIVYAVAFDEKTRFAFTETSAGLGEKWQLAGKKQ
jgi:WD40 repeat protein